MNFFIALLGVVTLASAKSIDLFNPESTTAYGYLARYGIPLAESIKAAQEANKGQRIVGGIPSIEGQYKYQAGLLISVVGLNGFGVCGGSLVSEDTILTAAHCWFDGVNQAFNFEVVLGSIDLYNGGTRVMTSDITVHENWNPDLIRNDVALARVATKIPISDLIAPVALPTASLMNEDFVGSEAVASGFGLTVDDGNIPGHLSHVSLKVISNVECAAIYGFIIQSSNICVDGSEGRSTCSGDSGGPLVVYRENGPILIGITSFGHVDGCQEGHPAAFVRVTSFLDWIRSRL